MGFEIVPSSSVCRITASIEYDLHRDRIGSWLGKLFGPGYARWTFGLINAVAVLIIACRYA